MYERFRSVHEMPQAALNFLLFQIKLAQVIFGFSGHFVTNQLYSKYKGLDFWYCAQLFRNPTALKSD